MKSIVLFGAGGQLGTALIHSLSEAWHVHALTRRQCDINDAVEVSMDLATARPNAVINAAGYTDVERTEESEVDAIAVNASAAGTIAAVARSVDAVFCELFDRFCIR